MGEAEVFLYCAIAFVAGLAAGRLLEGENVRWLRGQLRAREAMLKKRMAQLRCARAGQRLSVHAWGRVAQELEAAEPRRLLLARIAALLAELAVPEDARASLLESRKQPPLESARRDIERLIAELDDPRLRALWKSCSWESLHAMLAELVAQPPAANASRFQASTFPQDLLDPRGMHEVHSDFGGVQIIESFPAASG